MSPHGIELNLPDLPEVPIRLGSPGPVGPLDPASPVATGPKEPRGRWDRVREALATYSPLLLMAVLAVFTGWLVKSAPRAMPEALEAAVRSGPDYAMTGFQVQRHGADGRVQVLTLVDGERYEGTPGSRDFRRVRFAEYSIPLRIPDPAAGKLKLMAFVDKTRSRLRPEVGTINEVLPNAYNLVVWWGLLGPAGLPRPMVDRINAEAGKALGDTTTLADPAVVAKLKDQYQDEH